MLVKKKNQNCRNKIRGKRFKILHVLDLFETVRNKNPKFNNSPLFTYVGSNRKFVFKKIEISKYVWIRIKRISKFFLFNYQIKSTISDFHRYSYSRNSDFVTAVTFKRQILAEQFKKRKRKIQIKNDREIIKIHSKLELLFFNLTFLFTSI